MEISAVSLVSVEANPVSKFLLSVVRTSIQCGRVGEVGETLDAGTKSLEAEIRTNLLASQNH